MPRHDIIDNRKEKLVDHINRILSSTKSGRFAVGYFFLSGLESIAQRLAGVKELRLLIGNTTNRETLEQLAEGYRRLDLVTEAAEAEAYPKRTEMKRMANETAGNIRSAIELMDQTDEAQAVVTTLVRMIEEKRLKVKVYAKGRCTRRPTFSTTARCSEVMAGLWSVTKKALQSSDRRTSRCPASRTTRS